MKKIYLALAFLFFAVFSIQAITLGDQTLIPADHWVYQELDILCLETGTVSFATSAPRTCGELKKYLSQIEIQKLSPQGIEIYNHLQDFFLQEHLGFQTGLVSAGFALDLALEGYFKSNENIDYIYPYQKKLPLVNIPFGFNLGNYATLASEVTVAQNIEAKKDSKNYVNLPLPLSKFDVNFPHNTYGSFGIMFSENTGINFRIARGFQSIGNTATGSIILSDYSTNESYCEFSIFSPDFRYALNVTELNPPKKNNPDPAYMYLHRLELKFFDKLTFTILEGLLTNSPFELRFLNPLMIWHGYASWNDYYGNGNNSEEEIVNKEASLLGINIEFVPWNGLKFYFLYAMNQFQTSYERENWPDSAIPNAMAFQGGIELAFPLSIGYLTGFLEGVYATPYMYLMEGADWSYVRNYDESIGQDDVRQWVGTPFGPDSISIACGIEYKVPQKWQTSCSYVFSLQGELSDLDVLDKDYWPTNVTEASVKTPTGIPQFTHRIIISSGWQITKKLNLKTFMGYTILDNNEHIENHLEQGFELAASLKLNLL